MEMKNLKLVKACIYSDAKGNYFPVAFFANPLHAEYEEDQCNGIHRVRMLRSGMPCTNGCTIIPMGRCPIKGNFEMSLTRFENILVKYDCHFVCVIPCHDIHSTVDVYDAFRWMMWGKNKLPKGNETPSKGNGTSAQEMYDSSISPALEKVMEKISDAKKEGNTSCYIASGHRKLPVEVIETLLNAGYDISYCSFEKGYGDWFIQAFWHNPSKKGKIFCTTGSYGNPVEVTIQDYKNE